jgi:beta-N-acetylhexosaminidase
MSLEQDLGQLLVVGFPEAPERAPDFILDALEAGDISGTILFRRNVAEIEQVAALCESLHAAVPSELPPPFVALDQEGGRVVRLREPLTRIPPMRLVGLDRNADRAARIAEVVATEVATVGFNFNFAPVLDVDTNPDNPVIGDRSFGSDPALVARLGGAWALGHTMAGVIPCGKHFPGHGDTLQDSHLSLPTITHDRARLDAIELVPFKSAVKTNIASLMTAHIVVSSLDPVYPATLSSAIIQGLLRDEMGYNGVVVSDCLEMKAVADMFEIEELVERSLMAGVDLFLICHTEEKWRRARKHLLARAAEDEKVAARITESAARVRALKQRYLGSWPRPWARQQDWREVLGSTLHREELAALSHAADVGVDPTEA